MQQRDAADDGVARAVGAAVMQAVDQAGDRGGIGGAAPGERIRPAMPHIQRMLRGDDGSSYRSAWCAANRNRHGVWTIARAGMRARWLFRRAALADRRGGLTFSP